MGGICSCAMSISLRHGKIMSQMPADSSPDKGILNRYSKPKPPLVRGGVERKRDGGVVRENTIFYALLCLSLRLAFGLSRLVGSRCSKIIPPLREKSIGLKCPL